ncbi:MAG: hypothetical protein ACKVOO_10455 [Burkholderiaceae bacterium]
MNWNAYLDLYCERLAPGLWGEPLNALSNAAFWLAAWWVWRWGQRLRRQHQPASTGSLSSTGNAPAWHWEMDMLLVMLALIGAASALFHTFATRWAVALDSAFIALYLHTFLAVYAHRVMRLRWRWAWLGAPVFLALNLITAKLWAHALPALGALVQSATGWDMTGGGSGPSGYLAAWTVLVLLALHSRFVLADARPVARALMWACSVFLISLTLRQLDLPLCSQWRWGTHFAWHVLNAVTLGLTAYALLQASGAAVPRGTSAPARPAAPASPDGQ